MHARMYVITAAGAGVRRTLQVRRLAVVFFSYHELQHIFDRLFHSLRVYILVNINTEYLLTYYCTYSKRTGVASVPRSTSCSVSTWFRYSSVTKQSSYSYA